MKPNWEKFPATKDEYYSMLDYVMGIAEKSGMSEVQQMRLELGFEEAAANVINYAYTEKEDGKIQIRAYVEDERFFVELKDNGTPFNPLVVDKTIDKPKTLEEAKIGGLGIAFMQRIFDEMSYHYGREGKLFYNKLVLGMKMTQEEDDG